MKEHALRYASKGMAIFPVHPDGKAPIGKLVPSGVKDATTDAQKIRDWWGPVPSANIGLATGKIFVVDIDVKDEVDGRRTWGKLVDEHGEIPQTTVVSTPSGGMHLYFQAPDGVQIKNSVSDALGDGIDVRGHGGYVIVPPSNTTDGEYSFKSKQEVAEAPFWLLSRVAKSDGQSTNNQDVEVAEAPDQIPKGKRNDTLTSLAGYVRRKGLSEDEILNFLQGVNSARCSPPVADEELRRIASSVSRYEPTDALQVRGEEPDTPEQFKEMARRLVAALYEAPEHGPAVSASLPEPDALPAPHGAILSGMEAAGIKSGSLDRARLDAQLNGQLSEVKNPQGFDPTRFRDGRGVSQLVAWADALKARHSNNGIAQELRRLADDIENSDDHPSETAAEVYSRVQEHTSGQDTQMVSIKEAATDALHTVQEWKHGESTDILRTWPSVDDKIEGFKCGQMTVMGGFTSGFKTASLVDLAKRVALRNEDKDLVIPIFSAEMSAEEITHRMAANLCGVSAATLRPDREGNVTATEQQFNKYEAALDRIGHLSIEVDPSPNPSYEQMLSHCLQIESQREIAFVGFDYIEKMDEQAGSEELRVSKIAQNLKALAKRLDVPVVTLSQYSRQKDAHVRFPQNHYLRYSGKIEQEAQTIIHWFYPKYFVDRGTDPGQVNRYDPQDKHRIFAVCGKNRDGEVMNAKLHVNEETGRFIDRFDDNTPSPSPSDEAPF